MKRATINLKLITPCFLGGADQESRAEWRAQSIRGQLRWWFRAVAGGALGGDLKKTKQAEAQVFGSTERRSPIRIIVRNTAGPGEKPERLGYGERLSAEDLAERWGARRTDPDYRETIERLRVCAPNDRSMIVPTNPIEYLAFGPVAKGYLVRPMLRPGDELSFDLVWRPSEWARIPVERRRQFAWSLWSWLHLGSIGGRARKGFGSLQCTEVKGHLPPEAAEVPGLVGGSVDDLESAGKDLLGLARPTASGRWTHLSQDSRILVSTARYLRWEAAMEALGSWLIVFRRRYGSPSDPRVVGGVALSNRDYLWAEEASDPQKNPGGIPDKAGFGLPLPFDRQRSAVTWVSTARGQKNGKKKEDRRRASPLLLRIGCFGDSDFRPVLTHLPADLLPGDGELRYRYRGGNNKYVPRHSPSARPTEGQRSVVSRFLDLLEAEGRTLARRIEP